MSVRVSANPVCRVGILPAGSARILRAVPNRGWTSSPRGIRATSFDSSINKLRYGRRSFFPCPNIVLAYHPSHYRQCQRPIHAGDLRCLNCRRRSGTTNLISSVLADGGGMTRLAQVAEVGLCLCSETVMSNKSPNISACTHAVSLVEVPVKVVCREQI